MREWIQNQLEILGRDLLHIIGDVGLDIVVIILILCLLSFIAIIAQRYSKYLDVLSRKKTPPKTTKRSRFRNSHGLWKNIEVQQPDRSWSVNFWQGMSTEFWGAVVTTTFFSLSLLIFSQYQDIQNRKNDLIFQMGSDSNEIAKEAVRMLSYEGWLTDGTLRNIYLNDLNLERAELSNANLENTSLFEANLRYAVLISANLEGVNLFGAKLQEANLMNSNMQNINLAYADLQGADLNNANLSGAILMESNLEGVDLSFAIFAETTVLPDSDRFGSIDDPQYTKFWTPETDMSRYTDANHPDFWQPRWVNLQEEWE